VTDILAPRPRGHSPAPDLGPWSSLPAISSPLAALGVSSMNQVSGIGRYSTTFQLPASWNAGADGALLSFTHGTGDMVVAVTINGHTIGTIDQVTSTADAGELEAEPPVGAPFTGPARVES